LTETLRSIDGSTTGLERECKRRRVSGGRRVVDTQRVHGIDDLHGGEPKRPRCERRDRLPVLEAIAPFTTGPLGLTTVKVIDSVNSLGVDYAPPATHAPPLAFALKTSRTASIDRKVSVNAQRAMVSVTGVNRVKIPGSFAVHLMKDGKQIASRFVFSPMRWTSARHASRIQSRTSISICRSPRSPEASSVFRLNR